MKEQSIYFIKFFIIKRRTKFHINTFIATYLLLYVASASSAQSEKVKITDFEFFTVPHLIAGSTLSDITYRVIALHGSGIADRVVQLPATGTFTFLESADPSVIKWRFSARMDGKSPIENAVGEYRDSGKTQCFGGKCNVMTDASSPFFNPTFWGQPTGKLIVGKSWTVTIQTAWELGPAGTQTITVLSIDKQNGIIILKREGHGLGAYEGKHDSTTVKKGEKLVKVATKYGEAHWIGQTVFKRGVTVSDELLTITPVQLSSIETGVIQAEERQYMSLLQHPDPIPQ